MTRVLCVALAGLLACGCGGSKPGGDKPGGGKGAQGTKKMDGFQLTSSAFESGKPIPDAYTVNGDDTSPPLAWSGAPEGSKSFALICDDPDAPSDDPWVHWVIFNLPGEMSQLPAGIGQQGAPEGATQGVNSWPSENRGYRGPAPPEGDGPHNYHFTLYALDAPLELSGEVDKNQLLEAIAGHELGKAQLTGTYEREE